VRGWITETLAAIRQRGELEPSKRALNTEFGRRPELTRYNESNLPAIRAKRGVGRPPAVHLCRGDHMAREPRTSLGERGAACLRKSKQRRGRA
jgi:hypothetical protein